MRGALAAFRGAVEAARAHGLEPTPQAVLSGGSRGRGPSPGGPRALRRATRLAAGPLGLAASCSARLQALPEALSAAHRGAAVRRGVVEVERVERLEKEDGKALKLHVLGALAWDLVRFLGMCRKERRRFRVARSSSEWIMGYVAQVTLLSHPLLMAALPQEPRVEVSELRASHADVSKGAVKALRCLLWKRQGRGGCLWSDLKGFAPETPDAGRAIAAESTEGAFRCDGSLSERGGQWLWDTSYLLGLVLGPLRVKLSPACRLAAGKLSCRASACCSVRVPGLSARALRRRTCYEVLIPCELLDLGLVSGSDRLRLGESEGPEASISLFRGWKRAARRALRGRCKLILLPKVSCSIEPQACPMANHAVSSVLCLRRTLGRPGGSLLRCELPDIALVSSFIQARGKAAVHQVSSNSMLDWFKKSTSVKASRPHRPRRIKGQARLLLGPSRFSHHSDVRCSGLHQARQPDARWPALDLSSCSCLKMSSGSLSPCLMSRLAALLRD